MNNILIALRNSITCYSIRGIVSHRFQEGCQFPVEIKKGSLSSQPPSRLNLQRFEFLITCKEMTSNIWQFVPSHLVLQTELGKTNSNGFGRGQMRHDLRENGDVNNSV